MPLQINNPNLYFINKGINNRTNSTVPSAIANDKSFIPQDYFSKSSEFHNMLIQKNRNYDFNKGEMTYTNNSKNNNSNNSKNFIILSTSKSKNSPLIQDKFQAQLTENKQIIPEMWICSNCNSVNQAYDFKCRSCKLINNRQRDIIELTIKKSSTDSKESNTNTSEALRIANSNHKNNNLNAAFKKVSCLCYSNFKGSVVKNGICTMCHRVIEMKEKEQQQLNSRRGIVEREITYKNMNMHGGKAKGKESSPEIKTLKRPMTAKHNNSTNINANGNNNMKRNLVINRYEDEDNSRVIIINNANKNNKKGKELSNTMSGQGKFKSLKKNEMMLSGNYDYLKRKK